MVEAHHDELHLKPVKRTPWHVWVVGIVALLWSSVGAMDYLMCSRP